MAKYIDQEATAQKIKQIGAENYSGMYANIGMTHARQIVERMPAADVAPVVHGQWISCFEDWRKQIEGDKCSVCGFEHYGANIRNYKYCPNCGARMDGEENGS